MKFIKGTHVLGCCKTIIWNILNLFAEKITYHLIILTLTSLLFHILFILITFKIKIITRLVFYEAQCFMNITFRSLTSTII